MHYPFIDRLLTVYSKISAFHSRLCRRCTTQFESSGVTSITYRLRTTNDTLPVLD